MSSKLNLLIIDDEKKSMETYVKLLKREDKDDIIQNIIIDDEFPQSYEQLTDYNFTKFEMDFDAILIDYQLNVEYSGVWISAWLNLHKINAPRIALTGANYPGNKEFFDEYIVKREITDNPKEVIWKIRNSIENHNHEEWLKKRYLEIVGIYSQRCDSLVGDARKEDNSLKMLQKMLNDFEAIIDSKQNELIKTRLGEISLLNSNFSEIDEIDQDIQSKVTEISALMQRIEEKK